MIVVIVLRLTSLQIMMIVVLVLIVTSQQI